MSTIQENQIRAMLLLLDDHDEHTVDLVKQSLMQKGQDVMPSLLRAREIAEPNARVHLQSILDEMEFNQLETAYGEWATAKQGEPNLEEGAFLLAKVRYPDLDFRPYVQRLDEMALKLRNQLRNVTRPRTIIEKINRFLFDQEGFHGNTRHYYDPDNSYLNRVLDRKTGIPISLSLVYLLLTQRLGLPVTGVGLPGHFILKYETSAFSTYMDTFNNGQPISKEECIRFLMNSGAGIQESYFAPSTNQEMIVRMMRNLVFIYNQMKDKKRSQRLIRLIKAISGGSS
jgi:regulator of sirC expression with transglutaminase-like and TPR domain